MRPWAAAILLSRSYALLWSAQALSSFGEYLFLSTSTVWLVTRLAPDSPQLPSLVGFLLIATTAPRLLIAPLAGVWVDRWAAKRVMMGADIARALLFVALAIATGLLSPHVLVAALIGTILAASVGAQFFDPARSALMQVVVPTDMRPRAAGRAQFSAMGVAAVATALGPALLTAAGPIPAIITPACLYAASALLVAGVPESRVPNMGARASYSSELAHGFRTAWSVPRLRLVVIGMAVYGVSLGANNASLALFALNTLGLAAPEYGTISALFALGGIAGSIIGVRLVARCGAVTLFPIMLAALGATYLCYSFARGYSAAAILMAIAGLFFSLYAVCQGPLLQAAVPIGTMGRISTVAGQALAATSLATTVLVSTAFTAIGAETSKRYGYPGAIAASAGVLLVSGLILARASRSVGTTDS